jgi:signal peptidase I
VEVELDFEKRYRLLREIIETIVLTVLMFLVIRLAVQNFNVDGMSMEPNLHNQELILVDKGSYLFRAPGRGDIIVFVAPPQPTQDYVKRIIGLPGDVITVDNTKIIVNGKTLSDPYVNPAHQGNPFIANHIQNMVVPANSYFVLGDNRAGSSDSRDWGCVPRSNFIGRAAFIYWPISNASLIPNAASAFNGIPQPPTSGISRVCPIEHGTPVAALQPHNRDMNTISTALMLVMPGMFVFCTSKRRKPQKR